MKIKYLGTAAAEGIPAIYCDCEICKEARKLGGNEVRTRSQAIINGELIIDFPADTYFHSLKYGINLKDIHNYLITHSHIDHFFPDDIEMLRPGFAALPDDTAPYCFYSGKEVTDMLQTVKSNCNGLVEAVTLEPFNTYDAGGYTVTPLTANHGTLTPFIYIIEKDGKTLLYAHDTAVFTSETMDYIKERKPYFNYISWDCCNGNRYGIESSTHLCIGDIIELRKQFEIWGICDKHTVHCVNHFAHNGKDVLYKNKDIYESQGFIMSYDGLEVEF